MKLYFHLAAAAAMLATSTSLGAQTLTEVESVAVTETPVLVEQVPCNDYFVPNKAKSNWFIQLGAGIRTPLVENTPDDMGRHITATYNLGVGRWFTPYVGFRLSGYYGSMHWNHGQMLHAKTANLNMDFMWDMFNSLGGYKQDRVFSIVPFAGLGGTYVWDFEPARGNISNYHGTVKRSQWLMPVSAGLQLRFRLCNAVDFFAEGRALFYGDNFNNYAYGHSLDVDIQAIGGFSFYINGRGFNKMNPCDLIAYNNSLNNQVNDLRAQLAAANAATAAALAAAQNQPTEVVEAEEVIKQSVPMSVVRFKINSAYVSSEEMVNIYNMAQYLKANPNSKITVAGYADKDTGTSTYNMKLSQRRAQAVADILTGDYGINADRISIKAYGSDVQPYPDHNNWNRIVLMAD